MTIYFSQARKRKEQRMVKICEGICIASVGMALIFTIMLIIYNMSVV